MSGLNGGQNVLCFHHALHFCRTACFMATNVYLEVYSKILWLYVSLSDVADVDVAFDKIISNAWNGETERQFFKTVRSVFRF
jgi:hypothetical protein